MSKVTRVVSRLKPFAASVGPAAQLRTLATERAGTVILRVPSGTDSTQVVESLGRTMGRSVVRVDLDRVVSRFIGETEKNLDRLFADAAASGAVLLFDEADALLGKRSDIQDSHDRYADIEVSYLLQRIEAHSGIIVLASNAPQSVDPALARRWRHVVEVRWPPEDE